MCSWLLISVTIVLCFSQKKKPNPKTVDLVVLGFIYILNPLLLLNCVKYDYTEVLKGLFSKGKMYFYLPLPPYLEKLILSCLISLLLHNFLLFHMECVIKSVLFCDLSSKPDGADQ